MLSLLIAAILVMGWSLQSFTGNPYASASPGSKMQPQKMSKGMKMILWSWDSILVLRSQEPWAMISAAPGSRLN